VKAIDGIRLLAIVFTLALMGLALEARNGKPVDDSIDWDV